MQDRFNKYLDKTFGGLPKTADVLELREEILSNLLEKAAECTAKSMTDDAVYKYCIDSLGDYTEAIRALKTTPIDIVKSRHFRVFNRKTAVYFLTVLLIYFAVSFGTGLWQYTFVIPAGGTILYLSWLLVYLLHAAFTVKRPLLAYIYEGLLALMWATTLYFVLSYLPGVGYSKSWLAFTTMPALLACACLLTQKRIVKKASRILYSVVIMLFSVAIYLILSALLPAFSYGKAWIVILGGALVVAASWNYIK